MLKKLQYFKFSAKENLSTLFRFRSCVFKIMLLNFLTHLSPKKMIMLKMSKTFQSNCLPKYYQVEFKNCHNVLALSSHKFRKYILKNCLGSLPAAIFCLFVHV